MLVLKLLVLTAGVYCVHPDPVLKYKLGKKTSTKIIKNDYKNNNNNKLHYQGARLPTKAKTVETI